MALEKVPKVFDGIEFRRVGRQLDQRDIFRRLESARPMESCTIPNHHRMLVFSQRLRELFQEDIDHVRIEPWTQETFGLPRLGTHRTDHPQIVVLSLADCPWT